MEGEAKKRWPRRTEEKQRKRQTQVRKPVDCGVERGGKKKKDKRVRSQERIEVYVSAHTTDEENLTKKKRESLHEKERHYEELEKKLW